MNVTVEKIVNLLFQDTEMTSEAQALHDEVMTNCQDRYEDLIAQGKTQDEAIACVIESLKGMEDVIHACPKKRAEPVQEGTAEDGEDKVYRMDVEGLRQIDYDVANASLICEATDETELTVQFDEETCQGVEVRREGDRVHVFSQATGGGNGRGWLSRILGQISDRSDIVIRIPRTACPDLKAHLMSGDAQVRDVKLSAVDISSTSGDVNLRMPPEHHMRNASANSASGDVKMILSADEVSARSMSGDLELRVACDHLSATSVSGDVTVEGDIRHATMKSVSGDVYLYATHNELVSVNANSTSGDLSLRLCADAISLHANTVSGCVCSAIPQGDGGVQVSASTVSGDINVTKGVE